MIFNKIAQIKDMSELLEELHFLRSTGYSGEKEGIYYDYIYKWARTMKIVKTLNLLSNSTVLELGGGLSPLQFIFANNHSEVINLDITHTAWFPTNGLFYTGASQEFMNESLKNVEKIKFIQGNIYDTIKYIPDNSIDVAIDTCAIHTFLSEELIQQITRVLKPNGYMISVGDIANPYLGRSDHEFLYPKDLQKILSSSPNLKLVEPYDYDTWDVELMDFRHIIQRKNVDYTDLSLMNMKNDPKYLNFGNVATYPIHIWAATYVLQKTE